MFSFIKGFLDCFSGFGLLLKPGVKRFVLIPFVISAVKLCTSLWWMILGLLAFKWPGLIRHPLRPFADGFNRRCALAIFGAGLLLLVLLAVFIAIYMNVV